MYTYTYYQIHTHIQVNPTLQTILLIVFIDIFLLIFRFLIESHTNTTEKNTKKSQMLHNNKHLMRLLTIFFIDIIPTK